MTGVLPDASGIRGGAAIVLGRGPFSCCVDVGRRFSVRPNGSIRHFLTCGKGGPLPFCFTKLYQPKVATPGCHRSAAFDANPDATNPLYKPALDHIIASLEAGGDIGPHLSKGIMTGYESPTRLPQSPVQSNAHESGRKKRKTRRDLDLLLNDWSIYHLHLSTEAMKGGWIKRTDLLLFAVIKPQDAYLIDIAPHGSWYEENFIRIIASTWPDAGIVGELRGFTVPTLSTEQREEHRENYRVAGIPVDGKLYSPMVSLMASGHSEQSVDDADAVFGAMKPVEAHLRDAPERIVEMLTARGVVPPSEPDIHFEFFLEGGYGVVERKTGTRFPLPLEP